MVAPDGRPRPAAAGGTGRLCSTLPPSVSLAPCMTRFPHPHVQSVLAPASRRPSVELEGLGADEGPGRGRGQAEGLSCWWMCASRSCPSGAQRYGPHGGDPGSCSGGGSTVEEASWKDGVIYR